MSDTLTLQIYHIITYNHLTSDPETTLQKHTVIFQESLHSQPKLYIGDFCILPGSQEALLPLSPLRTVRESFQSYRSSLSNARRRTRFHNG